MSEQILSYKDQLDAICENINDKMDRDMQNASSTPPHGDFVVEWGGTQDSWYRLWKSGGLEQGGITSNMNNTAEKTSFTATITLNKSFSSKNIVITHSLNNNFALGNASASGYSYRIGCAKLNDNLKELYIQYYNNAAAAGTSCYVAWYTCGWNS